MSRGYGPKGQLLDSFRRLREAPDPCVIRRGCERPNTCRGKALRQAPDHPIRSSRSAPGKVVHIGNTPRRRRRRDVHRSDLLRRRNRRDPRREGADDARCARDGRARRDRRLDSRRSGSPRPRYFLHGTTVGLNALLTRTGAVVGLLVHPRLPRRARDRPRRPRRSLRPLLAPARAARPAGGCACRSPSAYARTARSGHRSSRRTSPPRSTSSRAEGVDVRRGRLHERLREPGARAGRGEAFCGSSASTARSRSRTASPASTASTSARARR